MKYCILMLSLVFLAGCEPLYSEADGKILCDPEAGKAYHIEHRFGDVSFLEPLPVADELCGGN